MGLRKQTVPFLPALAALGAALGAAVLYGTSVSTPTATRASAPSEASRAAVTVASSSVRKTRSLEIVASNMPKDAAEGDAYFELVELDSNEPWIAFVSIDEGSALFEEVPAGVRYQATLYSDAIGGRVITGLELLRGAADSIQTVTVDVKGLIESADLSR